MKIAQVRGRGESAFHTPLNELWGIPPMASRPDWPILGDADGIRYDPWACEIEATRFSE